MAASEPDPHAEAPSTRAPRWLLGEPLTERLEEEVSRAERHGTHLSCLLVEVENLDELAESYGGELRERAFEYLAAALGHELRRFDTIGRASARELLIVLPGADGARGEIVARRVLERLRTIKVEARGTRSTLQIAVGLTEWQTGAPAAELLEAARRAAHAGAAEGEGEQGEPAG